MRQLQRPNGGFCIRKWKVFIVRRHKTRKQHVGRIPTSLCCSWRWQLGLRGKDTVYEAKIDRQGSPADPDRQMSCRSCSRPFTIPFPMHAPLCQYIRYICFILKAMHVAHTHTHARACTHTILIRMIFTINGDQFPALR